jgi:DNA-binding transcriptional regulator YiaG
MTAKEIIELRSQLGWSQKKLADHIGIEVMTVSRWERGLHQPKGASIRALERLVKQANRRANMQAP